jgi:ABC-type polysaccharide/polyol phosphate transport system ATPase subunit
VLKVYHPVSLVRGYGVSKKKMMGFKNGVTMVFVSHPMSDVERICDRVMWIESHAINIVGEPKAVVDGYNKINYKK